MAVAFRLLPLGRRTTRNCHHENKCVCRRAFLAKTPCLTSMHVVAHQSRSQHSHGSPTIFCTESRVCAFNPKALEVQGLWAHKPSFCRVGVQGGRSQRRRPQPGTCRTGALESRETADEDPPCACQDLSSKSSQASHTLAQEACDPRRPATCRPQHSQSRAFHIPAGGQQDQTANSGSCPKSKAWDRDCGGPGGAPCATRCHCFCRRLSVAAYAGARRVLRRQRNLRSNRSEDRGPGQPCLPPCWPSLPFEPSLRTPAHGIDSNRHCG